MTDAFQTAGGDEAEVKRDSYGRYKLRHPADGKVRAWTRATTYAKSVSDTFALSQWSQRMVLKGAALRPDLTAMAYKLDVKAHKDRMNNLADQAKAAAGDKVAANLGTALHAFTEDLDKGLPVVVPDQHVRDVEAYRMALADAGLMVFPHLIERVTVITEFEVAGTFDRILQLPDGSWVIGDLKTGADLSYGWQEIAIQLALYAHGVNQAGVYDIRSETWEKLPFRVREDIAVVMHLPIGAGKCTLYQVDLRQGWEAAALCGKVREWRKRRNLASAFQVGEILPELDPVGREFTSTLAEDPAPMTAVVRPPTWEERFRAATSRGEMSQLFQLARAEVDRKELDRLTAIGKRKLATLEEAAG
jgi:hypothetical protein